MQPASSTAPTHNVRALASTQIPERGAPVPMSSKTTRVAGTILTQGGLYAVERFAHKTASKAAILTNNKQFREGRQVNFSNRKHIGWQDYDAGRIDMKPLFRTNPQQFRELQTESLAVPIEAQEAASAVDAPVQMKNSPFSHARADFLMTPPKDPAKPGEQIFVPLEPNGAGSAAYEGWHPLANARIQDAAYAFGERMVAKGPNARVLVLTSGSSALPKKFDQVKQDLIADGHNPEDITRQYVKEQGITVLEDATEKPGYEGSYDQHCIEVLGRMPPTAFSQEKTFGVTSGVAAALVNTYGQSEVHRIPFVPKSTDVFRDDHPDNFDDNYKADWNSTKASVMVMQMDDGIRNDTIEIRYEGDQTEATGGTLYVEGQKVNGVYNDGGFAQILESYQAKYDKAHPDEPKTFKLDSRATELCNDTLPMAEDKFQSTCLHNDFMKIYGHLYPSVVKYVPAYYCAGTPDDMLVAVKRLHDTDGVDAMPKAGKSRWGRGIIEPIKVGATDDSIRESCKKSKDDVDNTINSSGVMVAGQTYSMMQAYERAKATFGPEDKRALLNNAEVEVNVLTVADHSPRYDYKKDKVGAGFKFKSHVPMAKLTFERTANLSTNLGNIPAHLRTLPMHEAGMAAIGVTPEQCTELAKYNSHMWAFFGANRDLYQKIYRTSANDDPLRTPTRVPGP